MFPAATAVTVARNVARRGVFSHFCLCVQVLLNLAIKMRSTKLLQSLYYAPLIKNIITCNGNEEADFVFI